MRPGVRLVVLGKQGAGKGTQCVRLSHHYAVPHISTGDMLRAAVKSGSDLGRRAKEVMDRGELLPDELIMEMVAERVGEPDTRARGFILDGCPRTLLQADMLDDVVNPRRLDLVVDLEVPTSQVLRRLASRRVCVDCGANYSVTSRPTVNWICDVCGGEVVQREDDTEEAIRTRLELYERQTAPLIEWYAARGLLARVNGSGSPDAVTQRIVRAVETAVRRPDPGPAGPGGGGGDGPASPAAQAEEPSGLGGAESATPGEEPSGESAP